MFTVFLLAGCVSTGTAPRHHDGVSLSFARFPGSDIPEFEASVQIKSPLSNVMSVLTDFESWPEWAYGCRRAEIVASVGMSEAYLYQVTHLPLVRDRDMLMHASITPNESGSEVVIDVQAAPHYCDGKDRASCRDPNTSNLVRVTALSGSFRLQRLDQGRTEVVWRQHLDPDGMIPDWITRMMLPRVPIKSLRRLKRLVEMGDE